MSAPSVLIVDPSSDNREVLRTVLAQRGLTIFEADATAAGVQLARQHHPDVIVLDDEATAGPEANCQSASELHDQFAAASGEHASQLIILGKVRRGPAFTGGQVIAKPYHFAPLIHTIERMAAKAA